MAKTNPQVEEVVVPEVVEERLTQAEMDLLEKATMKNNLAKASAENAELAYKNTILTIFLQHGMSTADTITAEGVIVRAGK